MIGAMSAEGNCPQIIEGLIRKIQKTIKKPENQKY
jgi:hypothetical protein